MMQRLHKLLGNRWSLIAGRLPGRTPNDVKNYWNTYTRRKISSSSHKVGITNEKKEEKKTVVKPHVVLKPKARTISKRSLALWLMRSAGSVLSEDGGEISNIGAQHCSSNLTHQEACAATSSSECNNWMSNDHQWWETMMLHDMGANIENNNQCLLGCHDDLGKIVQDINCDGDGYENLASLATTHGGGDFLIEDQTWSDFLLDNKF